MVREPAAVLSRAGLAAAALAVVDVVFPRLPSGPVWLEVASLALVSIPLATVCVREHQYSVPYGVVKMSDEHLITIEEKPVYQTMVAAGIYVLEPEAVKLLPKARHYDMPNLLQDAVNRGMRAAVFPIHEYWIDIGRMEDLQRANEYLESEGPE